MDEIHEGGGRKKTKGALEGVKDTVSDLLQGDDEADESDEAEDAGERQEARREESGDRPRRRRSSSRERER